MKAIKFLSVAILPLAMLTACSESDTEKATKDAKAQMNVRMTDSPAAYSELNVDIQKVEIYSDNSGWIELESEAQSVNVIDLNNGNEIFLASNQEIDAGVYTKLRVTFGDQASLVTNTNLQLPLITINSQTEVMLDWEDSNVVEVEINESFTANSENSILIDFNVAESVREFEDGLRLDIVLEEVESEYTGVKGDIEGATEASVMLVGQGDTLSTYINSSGEFLLRGADEGEYSLMIMATAEASLSSETKSKTIENVVIVDGEIKQMGTIQL